MFMRCEPPGRSITREFAKVKGIGGDTVPCVRALFLKRGGEFVPS
jgi:hypothetical protein